MSDEDVKWGPSPYPEPGYGLKRAYPKKPAPEDDEDEKPRAKRRPYAVVAAEQIKGRP